jgi:hypothetical protein
MTEIDPDGARRRLGAGGAVVRDDGTPGTLDG